MEVAGVCCEVVGDMLIIAVEGEIDHHTAKIIREQIDREIIYKRPKVAVLELGDVGFMDSSGLGLMLGRYTLMQRLGGTLKVSNPTKQIEKILKLAGLEKFIPIIREERTSKK